MSRLDRIHAVVTIACWASLLGGAPQLGCLLVTGAWYHRGMSTLTQWACMGVTAPLWLLIVLAYARWLACYERTRLR